MRLVLVSVHQGLALGTSWPNSFPWLFASHCPLHCCKATSQACSCNHNPCHHLPISYCTIANCLCSGRSNSSQNGKEAEAPGVWAPGGSEEAGGYVCPLPWEWPHHPRPWSSQGLAVWCQVIMLWSYLELLRSSLLSYFLFFLSFPYFGQGVAAICETRWSPFSSKRTCQEHWFGVFLGGFLSTCAKISSQNQIVLLAYHLVRQYQTYSCVAATHT